MLISTIRRDPFDAASKAGAAHGQEEAIEPRSGGGGNCTRHLVGMRSLDWRNLLRHSRGNWNPARAERLCHATAASDLPHHPIPAGNLGNPPDPVLPPAGTVFRLGGAVGSNRCDELVVMVFLATLRRSTKSVGETVALANILRRLWLTICCGIEDTRTK